MTHKRFILIGCLCALSYSLPAQVVYIKDAGERQEAVATLFTPTGQPEVKLRAIPVSQVKLLNSLFA